LNKTIIKKTLNPQDITCIIDTREQTPLNIEPLKSIFGTLTTADYSVVGLEHCIALERKSLPDLVMCVGRERERFDREVQRLLAYPVKGLIIEANICQIELKQYRGDVHPNAVLASVMGWMARGLPIMWVNDHATAGKMAAKFLYVAAKRYWLQAYPFLMAQVSLDKPQPTPVVGQRSDTAPGQ
jgi:DNA excision repair protein ERCC-4